MSFQITVQQLSEFASHISSTEYPTLASAINSALVRFGIDQAPRRVRYFMAQTSFETGGFMNWSEDLTYSTPERLVAVWPTRFTLNKADTTRDYAYDYINNPQKLANLVYAGRNGNGDVASGDGYGFRGRGGLDLTFKNNYIQASKYLYGDQRLVESPDLVSQYEDGILTAGWFWQINGLSVLADTDSFTKVTSIINGSTSTVSQRLPVLNSANSIFTW